MNTVWRVTEDSPRKLEFRGRISLYGGSYIYDSFFSHVMILMVVVYVSVLAAFSAVDLLGVSDTSIRAPIYTISFLTVFAGCLYFLATRVFPRKELAWKFSPHRVEFIHDRAVLVMHGRRYFIRPGQKIIRYSSLTNPSLKEYLIRRTHKYWSLEFERANGDAFRLMLLEDEALARDYLERIKQIVQSRRPQVQVFDDAESVNA